MAKKQSRIDDLRAKEMAYGNQLTILKIIRIIAIYGIIMAAFSYVLYVNAILSVVLTLLALFYAYQKVLTSEVNNRYFKNGLDRRHEFINVMTLVLTNANNTPLTAINEATKNIQGEFKYDMIKLSATIKQFGGQGQQTHFAFLKLQTKYLDDVVFCQYLDQLETSVISGYLNLKIFQELAHNHDHMYAKQKDFDEAKRAQKLLLYQAITIIFIFTTAIASKGFGWQTYVDTFAHSIIGFGFSSFFMLVLILVIIKFLKYYYDDSITTI